MRYLFSPRTLADFQAFLDEDTLYAFDFDGTLAPIVMEANRASLPASTLALLRRLSRRVPVALLSGRSVADLKPRAPLPLVAWIGNHGFEGLPGDAARAKRVARTVAGWSRAVEKNLASIPGLRLENKIFSLTLHYRGSRKPSLVKREALKLAARLDPPPRILPGKCVVNLLMPGSPCKGSALQALMRKRCFPRAIFVGDDDTDEDVFRMQDPRVFSIRVGLKRSSMAQAYLKNQGEIDRLLKLLLSLQS